MTPALIKYTRRFDLEGSASEKPFEKIVQRIYYDAMEVFHHYFAENLEYFKARPQSMDVLNKVMTETGTAVGNLLKMQFPEQWEFNPEVRTPLSNVRIKLLAIDKSSIQPFKCKLYLTSDWITLIAILPHGLLVAAGDQSENIAGKKEFETYLCLFDNSEITAFKKI